MTKATNVTLQFVFSKGEEGDEGEEEDQRRQTRGGKEADLIGQAEVPENLIGQAEATMGFDRLPGLSWKRRQRKWSLIILMNSGTLDLESQTDTIK